MMRLRRARIIGFQSFADTGDLELSDGMNLIVGQNNSGKSALLRALRPESPPNDRHRTPEKWQEAELPRPKVEIDIDLAGEELRTAMTGRRTHYIPVPYDASIEEWVAGYFEKASICIKGFFRTGEANFQVPYPGHGLFIPRQQKKSASTNTTDGELRFGEYHSGSDTTGEIAHSVMLEKLFYFSAERMTVGQSKRGHVKRLAHNAQNLPAVLDTMGGERGDLLIALVAHLRDIFGTVGNLSVRPVPESKDEIEIRTWPTAARENVELSFPLNSSGTGVAQVIAILAAVMTVERAVITIDEINSFLHPAAVKALLRILQTHYAQHQYLISTHAPEVIGFSNPRTLHLVKREGYESTVQPMNLDDISSFREVADILGVSMADVFAADRIIWVEGPTEELCFPLIYRHATREPLPRGSIFTSVAATGDLTRKRDREIVYEVYRRLSTAASPLVKKVAFSFDSEKLSPLEKSEMTRSSRGDLHFLPRRHLECYLLDAEAIAAFLNDKDAEQGARINTQDVSRTLEELAATSTFAIPEWKSDLQDSTWQASVDAANLIRRTCTDLSDSRVTFNKKDDSLWLLQHLLEHEPDQLSELANYVCSLVAHVTD